MHGLRALTPCTIPPACSRSAPHQTESPQTAEEAQAGSGRGVPVTPSAGRAQQAQAEHMLGSLSREG